MNGVIRKRDILAHPFVTIRSFGWRIFFRALFADHNETFISVLTNNEDLQAPPVKVPELVERCINLELQAKRIYERLAEQFADHKSVSDFFTKLARQEQNHAELLELCRAIARRTIWREEAFTPCRNSIPLLERHMENIEASLKLTDSIADALRLVIQIEGSEVNATFESVVTASRSAFAKRVLVFQNVVENHIDYICEQIPKFEPNLAQESQELWDRYFVNEP